LPTSIASGATPSSSNSRKIAGFHCLCVSVGTISGHDLTGYIAGDILPRSVWDLFKKPVSAPEGMVLSKDGMWVDIYLPSWNSGLVSAYGGTVVNGDFSTGSAPYDFHWYNFVEEFHKVNKRLCWQSEFIGFATGSNQETNIYGSGAQPSAGGHLDTASRRMISDIGVEDCAGAFWQWSLDAAAEFTTTGWAVTDVPSQTGKVPLDGAESIGRGQFYKDPNRALLGGYWGSGSAGGSRSSWWNYSPLYLNASFSGRAVAESAGSRF
jgi:hypothetical protein